MNAASEIAFLICLFFVEGHLSCPIGRVTSVCCVENVSMSFTWNSGRLTESYRTAIQRARTHTDFFNHLCVDTDHILLAVFEDAGSAMDTVLSTFDINVHAVLSEFVRLRPPGPVHNCSGIIPSSGDTKAAVDYSFKEADRVEQRHVETVHLFLGLLRIECGAAVRLLTNIGENVHLLRRGTLQYIGGHNAS
ncbi:MAG: hypothetical protein IH899_01935 [Planctomycetes bacterium]|nr:hypothetical protein [Planctomycetota bacterium]